MFVDRQNRLCIDIVIETDRLLALLVIAIETLFMHCPHILMGFGIHTLRVIQSIALRRQIGFLSDKLVEE